MASTVIWRDGMASPEVSTGLKNLPKKPVIWWGSAVVYLKDGTRSESTWRARKPMTTDQAKEAMRAVVKDLISDIDKDLAVDSGFIMQCR